MLIFGKVSIVCKCDISHIDCDDTENIATKDKVIQIVTSY